MKLCDLLGAHLPAWQHASLGTDHDTHDDHDQGDDDEPVHLEVFLARHRALVAQLALRKWEKLRDTGATRGDADTPATRRDAS